MSNSTIVQTIIFYSRAHQDETSMDWIDKIIYSFSIILQLLQSLKNNDESRLNMRLHSMSRTILLLTDGGMPLDAMHK